MRRAAPPLAVVLSEAKDLLPTSRGFDGDARTPVSFLGIVPDLFREGSGVVAEGRLVNGTFVADNILAKHDERYMPPELGNLAAEHKAGRTVKE